MLLVLEQKEHRRQSQQCKQHGPPELQGKATTHQVMQDHPITHVLQAEARNIQDHPPDLVPAQVIQDQAQGAAPHIRDLLQAPEAVQATRDHHLLQAAVRVTQDQAVAVRAPQGQAVAVQVTPGRAAAVRATPGRAVAVQVTPGRAAAVRAPQGQAAAVRAPQGQAAAPADHQVVAQEAAALAGDKIQPVNNSISKHLSNIQKKTQ